MTIQKSNSNEIPPLRRFEGRFLCGVGLLLSGVLFWVVFVPSFSSILMALMLCGVILALAWGGRRHHSKSQNFIHFNAADLPVKTVARVLAKDVIIYSGPNLESSPVGEAHQGDEITLGERLEDVDGTSWVSATLPNSNSGYIQGDTRVYWFGMVVEAGKRTERRKAGLIAAGIFLFGIALRFDDIEAKREWLNEPMGKGIVCFCGRDAVSAGTLIYRYGGGSQNFAYCKYHNRSGLLFILQFFLLLVGGAMSVVCVLDELREAFGHPPILVNNVGT